MTTADSTRAELLKLRNRPATWVLGAVLVASVLVFAYLLTYLLLSALPTETAQPSPGGPQVFGEEELNNQMETLLPEGLLSIVLPLIHQFGASVALILGALVMGSEYGWGTLKTIFNQRVSRIGILSGKLVALGITVAVLVTLTFTMGALSSYGVALLEENSTSWPAFAESVRALGAAALIMIAWSALGLFLAALFRGTALAIGLGLVYALVLEGIVTNLPTDNELLKTVRKFLLGENSSSLAGSFSDTTDALGLASSPVEPTQAAILLCVYTVGFFLLTAFLLRHRDVA